MNPLDDARLNRRQALKWMLTAAASTSLLGLAGRAQERRDTNPYTPDIDVSPVKGQGYGTDPDLLKTYAPGDIWPLIFSDHQLATTTVLCALIIPRDERSPSAADLRVQDFIDEWISAPYAMQEPDRPVILEGLQWLDQEAQRRFGKNFVDLQENQPVAICDDIGPEGEPAPAFAQPARFFTRFRELTASGYYTTPEGMKDIGYVGNTPLAEFKGPPPAVLRQLGLA